MPRMLTPVTTLNVHTQLTRRVLEALHEKERNDAVSDGVIIALAVMHSHGDSLGGRYYEDILNTAGRNAVIARARKTGSMRWSGLDRFLRYERAP